ncbi:hypothetical protein [Pseudorhodobacter sp. E13]|uniref:hypothetical protein n=1 Tax=Pseudorhodobacter sp. E13 TaxID=2487931 RepID=UPI000F8CE644|nr:hypothetical protein [Pseudorhodobacter sp. E13]
MKIHVDKADIYREVYTPQGKLVILNWISVKEKYGVSTSDNLWLIDDSGERIWIATKTETPGKPYLLAYKEPFTEIVHNTEGAWVGITYSGDNFLIDLNNGFCQHKGWGK